MNELMATRHARTMPQATANRFLARIRVFPAGEISHSMVSGDKEDQEATKIPTLRTDKSSTSTNATNQ